MRAATQTFEEKIAVVSVSRSATGWETAPGLDATEMIPEHILHSFATLYEDYGLNEKYCHISLGVWSLMRRSRLYFTDPEVMLGKECCKTGVSVRRSTRQNARAGNRVLASRNFGGRGGLGGITGRWRSGISDGSCDQGSSMRRDFEGNSAVVLELGGGVGGGEF